MIVQMSLYQGAVFFACIVWMVEGNFLAVGVLAELMLLHFIIFPTKHSLENWINRQLEVIRAA